MPTRINIYPRGAVRECVSGQVYCKKTPSEYASSGYIVWGAGMRPTYLRGPNLCYLLCSLVPCQVDGTPVVCISASAAPPYVRVCFIFSDVCLHHTLPPLGALVSSLPHQLDIEILVFFFELCVAALFFFLFFFSCFPAGVILPFFSWSIT